METQNCINLALNIDLELNQYIEQAIEMLKEDIVKYPPVDLAYPYEYKEKNYYFDRVNACGVWLLRLGKYWAAEIFYLRVTEFIKAYEKETGQKHNKGIVYVNLGIAQIKNNKFDEGVGYFIAADEEDRPFEEEGHTVLDTFLWGPTESEIIKFITELCKIDSLVTVFQSTFIRDFVRELDIDDWLFLCGAIWSIKQNIQHYQTTPNKYTRGRLYSALSDLCLLTESLVRKNWNKSNGNEAESKGLSYFLDQIIPKVKYQSTGFKYNATSPADFKNKLEIILENTKDEVSWISCLLLTRNYLAHRFDYLTGMASNSDFFTDTYVRAVENTLLAIFYLKKINAI
jgi:tetratricopeptide (TPR) repeat protein